MSRSARFEFGENWRDYARLVDQSGVDQSIEGLRKLFPSGLSGKTFLDLGCGSGLHAAAALLLGARSVTAIDIDENSVDTTRRLLEKLVPGKAWKAEVRSVFDLASSDMLFDVVYSWGVLHHTGNMWRAIEIASRLVAPGGSLAIAIYAKTRMDWFWKIEKRIYCRSPSPFRWIVRQAYVGAYLVNELVRKKKGPLMILRGEHKSRGMDFLHDIHDWLGGYPYETADATEIREKLASLGFSESHSFVVPPSFGLFGAGNSEFVFSRVPDVPAPVLGRP
jgi:SAM-dependent methyltransferase